MSAVRSLAPRFSFLGERMFHSFTRLYLGTRFGLTIWRQTGISGNNRKAFVTKGFPHYRRISSQSD
jgi:hypothetical protein